jgi:hypothetical protein
MEPYCLELVLVTDGKFTQARVLTRVDYGLIHQVNDQSAEVFEMRRFCAHF